MKLNDMYGSFDMEEECEAQHLAAALNIDEAHYTASHRKPEHLSWPRKGKSAPSKSWDLPLHVPQVEEASSQLYVDAARDDTRLASLLSSLKSIPTSLDFSVQFPPRIARQDGSYIRAASRG